MSQQADYDCYGWNPVRGLPANESYGLDYESAREVTPRWYGVSFGDGNGVSHTWPDYYVRTADPFMLAGAAIVANWNDDDMRSFVVENAEINGEADYTIYATILNPPDDESNEWECECGISRDDDICTVCESGRPEMGDNVSWCDANGAWLIVEVFPVGDMPGALLPFDDRPAYVSLLSCFSESDLALAAQI